MRIKFRGILVCTLVAISTLCTATDITILYDDLDQYQIIDEGGIIVSAYNDMAQEFVPSLDVLTRVEIKLTKVGNPESFKVSIREDLDYDDLTSLTIFAEEIPAGTSWVEFDLPDIGVNQTQYFIVCSTLSGITSDYYEWRYTGSNLYLSGSAWQYDPFSEQWSRREQEDFCFKTYGRINRPPSQPRKPHGTALGKTGNLYTYKTTAYDPDTDKISYYFDWDGDLHADEWTLYYEPGIEIFIPHSWDEGGGFEIRVKAYDEYGAYSDWSDPLTVVIPRNRSVIINNSLVLFFLKEIIERFSLAV